MADEQAPRKQRHTARRIWQRIREESPQASVGETNEPCKVNLARFQRCQWGVSGAQF
jgi:hypothetical protein